MQFQQARPVQIKRLTEEGDGTGLEIKWSNDTTSVFSSSFLRSNCPCATCIEERGDTRHQKPLSQSPSSLQVVEATEDEAIRLEEIWSIGSYALGMRWGDKHDTGIYSFDYLIELAKKSK